jgi:hypothetical protein
VCSQFFLSILIPSVASCMFCDLRVDKSALLVCDPSVAYRSHCSEAVVSYLLSSNHYAPRWWDMWSCFHSWSFLFVLKVFVELITRYSVSFIPMYITDNIKNVN